MPRKRGERPRLLLHRATGQGYVTYRGKSLYFGPFDDKDTRKKYDAFIARWEKENDGSIVAAPEVGSIAELCADFQAQVARHFSKDERLAVKRNLADLIDRFGLLPPDDFGPRELKELRSVWLDRGHLRQTINKKVGRVRRVFRWALAEDKIQATTMVALDAVSDLALGRTTAGEYRKVHPAPIRDVVRARRYLNSTFRTMVRLQFHVGMRPGELCRMTREELYVKSAPHDGRMITVPDGHLAFKPTEHKNKSKGIDLTYLVPPYAVKILTPYLNRSGYLFPPGPRKGGKKPGPYYSVTTYAHAVRDACNEAGVPVWSPNQLRHLFITKHERLVGHDLTSKIIGHTSLKTTARYIEKSFREFAAFFDKHR